MKMDEALVQCYRKYCREGFKHTGELETPSIFLDTVGEKIRICGHSTNNYIHIFLNIRQGLIEDVKYMCTCDPTANVAVEIFCTLTKGKTIDEAESLTENDFSGAIGSAGEEYLKKARGIIDLLHRGIARYKASIH